MSQLNKVFVLIGLLFLGVFVSASLQPVSERFVDPRLECAKPTYDVGVRWMCVQNVTPIPSQPEFWVCWFGQAGIPNYPIPGAGGYNSWKVRLTDIDEGTSYHTASFVCYHDTSGDSKRVAVPGFDLTSTSGGGLDYANLSFQVVATVEIDEGLSAYGQSAEWQAAGCPNINYMNYQFAEGVAQAQVSVGWFSGKQSAPQVNERVSSVSESSRTVSRVELPVSRVRQSVSRVSRVLSRVSSYFRQRNFRR